MDMGKDFVGGKMVKKAFLAVLLAVLAQKYPKKHSFFVSSEK